MRNILFQKQFYQKAAENSQNRVFCRCQSERLIISLANQSAPNETLNLNQANYRLSSPAIINQGGS